MITGINESKTLINHISCECKCKFDKKKVIQISCGIMINVDLSVKTSYMWKRFCLESYYM